jgi:hypothetical protein
MNLHAVWIIYLLSTQKITIWFDNTFARRRRHLSFHLPLINTSGDDTTWLAEPRWFQDQTHVI